jgi:hypothetical protein
MVEFLLKSIIASDKQKDHKYWVEKNGTLKKTKQKFLVLILLIILNCKSKEQNYRCFMKLSDKEFVLKYI